MLIAVVIILLMIGSVIFHFVSPWWFTPIASNWGMIDNTIMITFWVTGTVFILVSLFLAYTVMRFKHKEGQQALYEPENKKLEGWLSVITACGVAAMLAPGLLVWGDIIAVPDDAAEFEVVGQQWHWSYRFPGKDGEMGKIDQRLISVDNPFGIDPNDPLGQDDILIADPEVHLPVNQSVKALLRSKDVLHDFAVPQFRVKMDLVPGMETFVWFKPTREGDFDLLCEELCGLAHHAMRGRIVVESEQDFQTWLAGYPTYAETAAQAKGDAVVGKAQYAACAACHGFEGEGIPALNAPKLSGQEAWYLTRQLNNYKRGTRGKHENDALGQQMAAMAMTLADDQAVRNVAAYIGTLPDKPAEATITGDTNRGAAIYANCAACHGADGQGIWALNAPRQAGMSDWYIAAQLKNFQQGIRGAHRADFYGGQMASMADSLTDEQAINDLVAYINTL